ncbi:MAG: hypothetical protein ABL958_03075, partial [Bdellovibrionia bacterium]
MKRMFLAAVFLGLAACNSNSELKFKPPSDLNSTSGVSERTQLGWDDVKMKVFTSNCNGCHFK